MADEVAKQDSAWTCIPREGVAGGQTDGCHCIGGCAIWELTDLTDEAWGAWPTILSCLMKSMAYAMAGDSLTWALAFAYISK